MSRRTRRLRYLLIAAVLVFLLGECIRWQLDIRQRQAAFDGHRGIVLCVAFSPDGQTLASGGFDGTIRFSDPHTGQQLAMLEVGRMATKTILSPDGKYLAVGNWQEIDLWNVSEGKVEYRWATPDCVVRHLAFSPDGTRVAGICNAYAKIWTFPAGEEVLAVKGSEIVPSRGSHDDVLCLAFSPDRGVLATGGLDDTIRFWDVKSGNEIARLTDTNRMIWKLAFTPDGKILASMTTDDVTLWDVNTKEKLTSWKPGQYWLAAMAISPNGKLLATASGDNTSPFTSIMHPGQVKLWDLETRQVRATYRWHWGAISDVAFSPDSTLLATSCYDGRVRIWRVPVLQ